MPKQMLKLFLEFKLLIKNIVLSENMSEYLGHELMKAIDASESICGHPGHFFTTYSPKDKTCGMVKVMIIRNASSASNI